MTMNLLSREMHLFLTSSQELQKPLEALVHGPQKPSLAGLLQLSLGTIHRVASRAGFTLGEASLAPRLMQVEAGERWAPRQMCSLLVPGHLC